MERKKTEYIWIYIVKIIAALLVSWGHLIGTSTWQNESVWGVITQIEGTSLLPSDTHVLWKVEAFFYGLLHVEAAVIGVVLFFLMSGFFLPRLQEKHNVPSQMPRLLISRMKRIYPVTIVCTIVVGLIAYLLQGIKFRAIDYISTALVIPTITRAQATMGVLWYLMVLMFVYLLLSIIPHITLSNLTGIYALLYVMVLIPKMLGEVPEGWIFTNIEYVAKFCGIPLLGAAMYFIRQRKSYFERLIAFLWFFGATFLLLKLDSMLYGTEHTYTNIWTYICSFGIIVLAIMADKAIAQRANVISLLRNIEKYLFHFYLVHVGVGLTTIFYLRHFNINSYICVLAAYIVSAVVTVVTYHFSRSLVVMASKMKKYSICAANRGE